MLFAGSSSAGSKAKSGTRSTHRSTSATPGAAAAAAAAARGTAFATAAATNNEGGDDIRPPSRGAFASHGNSSSAGLRGRLTDGTLHRLSVTQAGLTAAHTATAPHATATLGDNSCENSDGGDRGGGGSGAAAVLAVQSSALRGTWAADFHSAESMRAAVTTTADTYTAFEEALIEEINLLRTDPRAYAALVEREATLGYPFACADDEHFPSTAAADVVHGFSPEALDALVARRHGSRPFSADNASVGTTGLSTGTGGTGGHHSTSGATVTMADGAAPSKQPLPAAGSEEMGSRTKGRSSSRRTHDTGEQRSSGAAADVTNADTMTVATGTAAPDGRSHAGTTGTSGAAGSGTTDTYGGGSGGCEGDSPLLRTTLRGSGMDKLNLGQLRTHFQHHERHRDALEIAQRAIIARWRQAQQALQEVWQHEDEKAQKKNKRGGAGAGGNTSGSSGNSGSNSQSTAAGRKRSVQSGGLTPEELAQSRKAATDKTNTAFASQLRTVTAELQAERAACRRAMEGANIILDCVRALRDARPVPPLRLSRGLTLAARDTTAQFHADPVRVAVLRDVDVAVRRGSRPTMTGDRERASSFQVSTAAMGGSGGGPSGDDTGPVMVTEEGRVLLGGRRMDIDAHAGTTAFFTAAVSDGGAVSQRAAGAATAAATRSDAEVLAAFGLSPVAARAELDALASAAQSACGPYGYVSGEVRGLQLYGAGSPRQLVMRALLGVATPVFRFAEAAGCATTATATATVSSISMDGGNGATHVEKASAEGDAVGRQQFQESIFNSARGYTTANGTPSASMIDDETICMPINTTALALCGRLHPTTPAAARLFTQDVSSARTTADRRAAQAAYRLGPLLWPAAHLAGSAWTRIEPQQEVPTYDAAVRAMTDAAAASLDHPDGEGAGALPLSHDEPTPLVGTTLLFASGFEELDMIRRCGASSTLAAVRRIVHERISGGDGERRVHAGATRSLASAPHTGMAAGEAGKAIHGGGTKLTGTAVDGKAALPAVVDLHSACGVRLISPETHPLRLTLPQTSTITQAHRNASSNENPTSRGGDGGSVVAVVAYADARHVQLQACVTAAGTTPSAPTLDATLVLTQRSPTDESVTVVLVDAAAVAGALGGEPTIRNCGAGESPPPHRTEALLHLFERRKQFDGEEPVERGGTAMADTVTEATTSDEAPTPRASSVSVAKAASPAPAAATPTLTPIEASGYTHIGFIRLLIETPASLAGATTTTTTTRATGSAVRAVSVLRGPVVEVDASQNTMTTPAAQPYLEALELSHRFFAITAALAKGTSGSTRSHHEDFAQSSSRTPSLTQQQHRGSTLARTCDGCTGVHVTTASRTRGWPTLSQDFCERGASVLAPLTPFMNSGPTTATAAAASSPTSTSSEKNGDAQVVWVRVRVPPAALTGYLGRHTAALRAQLERLLAISAEEERMAVPPTVESRSSPTPALNETAPTSTLVPATEAADQTPTPAETAVVAAAGLSMREEATPAATVAAGGGGSPPKPTSGTKDSATRKEVITAAAISTSNASSSSGADAASPSTSGARSHYSTKAAPSPPPAAAAADLSGMSIESGSSALHDSSLQALLAVPTAHFRAAGYLDTAYLARVSLDLLRTITEELSTAASESQVRVGRAESLLAAELARVRAESERRKGRELLRLRHEEADISHQMAEASRSSAELIAAAAAAKQIWLRRTRERALRQARTARLQAELAALGVGAVASADVHAAAAVNRATQSFSTDEPREIVLWLSAAAAARVPNPRVAAAPSLTAVPPLHRCSPRAIAASSSTAAHASWSTSTDLTATASGESYYVPLRRTDAASADAAATAFAITDTIPRPVTPVGHLSGANGAAEISHLYETSVRIPEQFRGGRAVLLIDGIENVAWHIM